MTQQTIERMQPFATPIFRLRVPEFEAFNEALRASILARQAADPGLQRSNGSGSWHSADDAHRWDDAAMRQLCLAAGRALVQALGHHYPAGGKLEAQLAACWANVNTEGGWNMPHQHSGFPWVGSYYVDVGPAEAPEAHLGRISFINPLAGANSFWQPQQFTLEPQAGDLLLFPGGMLHYVHPNPGPAPRISVAFNFQVKAAQQPWA